MLSPNASKFRIRENDALLTIRAPQDFTRRLAGLPNGVRMGGSLKNFQQIHWFVTTCAQLEKEMSKVMRLLREDMLLWVYFPKSSSGLQTDLTRDRGWDCLEREKDRLARINLVSLDETWSAFGFRARSKPTKERTSGPQKNELSKWIDPDKKLVRIPPDLQQALADHPREETFFHSLAYSHRKEYVAWILEARREETRQRRIEGTIERLKKHWKNPANN